jgi:hypothetical protein
MKTTVILCTLCLAPIGCQSAEMAEFAEIGTKGTTVGGAAAIGAALGGPLGATVGAVLSWLGLELAESRVDEKASDELATGVQAGAAEREKAAFAAGSQQAADNANAGMATLLGNPELAKMFSEKAAEATAGLKNKVADVESFVWRVIWRVGLVLTLLAGLIVGVWWFWLRDRKQTKEKLERLDKPGDSV